MVVLSMPCSIKLQSFKASLDTQGRKLSHVIASTTITRSPTIKTSYQTNKSLQAINNSPFHKATFQEFSLGGNMSISGQTLIKEADQELEKEIDSTIQKLKIVVERVREMEINKFMDRVKGKISQEDYILLVDRMSKEFVTEFLERPIRYVTSCDGNLEEKIKDMNLLVDMLEESCS